MKKDTSNLSRALMTRDSIDPATGAISLQRAIKEYCVLKKYPNLKPLYRRLFERRRLKLRWLKIYHLY